MAESGDYAMTCEAFDGAYLANLPEDNKISHRPSIFDKLKRQRL